MKPPHLISAMISAKLVARRLPDERPVATSTGKGTGTACAACDDPIRAVDVECETEYAGQPVLRFHIDCFTEWRRQQRQA